MNNVYAFWYKEKGVPNFGDELNPYIISKLSGSNVVYVPFVGNLFSSIIFILKCILKGNFEYIIPTIKYFRKSVIIGIGSIIELYSSSRAIVWGSGLITSTSHIHNAKFMAVRGEYTKSRIESLGYTSPQALGDPAILLPLVYTPINSKKYKLGIIPHHIHYAEAVKLFKNVEEVLVINLFNEIESVIDDIFSCEMTASSSLHGIIVSHSYGVPCIWGTFKDGLAGDNVKFLDYFSSMKILNYDAIDLENSTFENIVNKINLREGMLPNINLETLQRLLLKSAPFSILNKFNNI